MSKPCPSQVPIKKLIFPFLTHTRHEWTCVNAVPESYTCQTRVWCPFSHVRASQNKSIHIHFGLGRPPFLKKECQITFLTRNRLSTLRKPKLIINRNLRQFLTTNQLVHEHKSLSQSGVNAPRLPSNWFWQAGLVVCRFYQLKVSPKCSSLERFPTFKFFFFKKKKKRLGRIHLWPSKWY